MLLEIHEFVIDHEGLPTDEEIQHAIQLRRKYVNALFTLKWYMYYSGWHQVDILESDRSVDDVRKRMPKVYGL